ncbi:BEL1-like homeodomain protein 2 [Linum grandiflorum]
MGIAILASSTSLPHCVDFDSPPCYSMSQDYHHPDGGGNDGGEGGVGGGMFSFSSGNGFDRNPPQQHQQKLRIQAEYPPPPQSSLVGIDERQEEQDSIAHHHHQNQTSESSNYMNAAAAMQLFLPRSPSPSPHSRHSSNSTLHMLLPDPHQQFSWIPGGGAAPPSEIGGVVEGQGLSLSLSSSLQHLEAAKAEELRIGDAAGVFYYNQPGQAVAAAAAAAPSSSSSAAAQYYRQQHALQQQNQQLQVGLGSGSGLGVVNVLRHSKYVKAAQELLEEFCSVGRGQFKKNKSLARLNSNNSNGGGGGGGGSSGTSSKEFPAPPLSSSDRMEHQRRKVKLISMLDEVDRRYNHYCEQMQMVVNSFDLVMGFGAAVPYTALAQKAMSRHFRCLKDAIAAQLKQSCEMLGEKDSAAAGGSAGITRGETPRLKALEQSLRQQRAFHQMGMMEQEAWRPQRGLPERSVNILRAWLFEHFLHPYPSDADKHLLARQTGLSRNQVSNWFINARVRLWKPMIEDMYQQEAKEADDDTSQDNREHEQAVQQTSSPPTTNTTTVAMSSLAVGITSQASMRSGIGEENDPSSSSLMAINRQCFSENQASTTTTTTNINTAGPTMMSSATDMAFHDFADDPTCHRRAGSGIIAPDYAGTSVGGHHHVYGTTAAAAAAAGDVSLTLGLRHAGNMPEKASSTFSIRDFGDC